MEVSQRIKTRSTKWPSNSTTRYLSEENEKTNSNRYMHPIFIVALLTIAEIWKQSRYLSMDEQIKMWNTCNGTLFSHKKRMQPCHVGLHGWPLWV